MSRIHWVEKIGSSCVIYRFDVLLQHRTVRPSSKTNGCDERKKTEDEKSTRLGYTGLNPRVMGESLGEYVLLK